MMNGCRPPPPPDPVLVLSGKCAVTSLVFLDYNTLVSGHQNGQIQEWSIPIQRVLTSWDAHSDTVLWLANFHGKLFSQGRDGLVKAWAKSSVEWMIIVQVSSAPLIFCNSVVLDSTSAKLLVIPSVETSHVNIHEILTTTTTTDHNAILSISQSPAHTLKPISAKGYGMCMKMCPVDQDHQTNGHLVLIGYESGSIALWDASQGEMLHSHKLHNDSVMCLSCWSGPSSEHVIGLSASVNNVIQCWKILDNNAITINKETENSVSVVNEGFNDIAIRKDGRIFATGGWDGTGRVIGVKKLSPLAVLTYHKESINCVVFSPNNELIMASKDGYITFWDVYKNS